MTIQVVAAIIEHDGRLLICQRCVGGPFGLKWEFPGGKMRPGETAEAALARELREELGVEAHIGQLLSRVRHRYSELADAIELTFFAATLAADANDGSRISNFVFEQIR